MATPVPHSKLVRWDVPFAEWNGMRIWTVAEKGFDNLMVVVAPLSQNAPIDNYPKYLLRFDKIITFLTYDETFAFDRGYLSLPGWTKGVRAYQWVDSPWLNSYSGWFESGGKKLFHYIVLGDDSLTEVISVGEARVERVESKRLIKVEHEV